MTDIASPCQKICRLDETHSYCQTCGRAIDEIATWGRISEDERRRIMEEIPTRNTHDMIARAAARRVKKKDT